MAVDEARSITVIQSNVVSLHLRFSGRCKALVRQLCRRISDTRYSEINNVRQRNYRKQ